MGLTITQITIENFLDGVNIRTDKGERYYHLWDLYKKIGHNPCSSELTSSYPMLHSFVNKLADEHYIKHTVAYIIVIRYFMADEKTPARRQVVSAANQDLVQAKEALTQITLDHHDSLSRGKGSDIQLLPIDVIALDKVKKNYAECIVKVQQ